MSTTVDDIQTSFIKCGIVNQVNIEQKDCNGLVNMNNDITLLIASYLSAQDMLNLALSCRRFGAVDKNEKYGMRIRKFETAKKVVLYRHPLMEEAARRELTKNLSKQQKRLVPWCKGDSWIGLFNNPEKIQNWKMLNAYQATGKRKDRQFLMDAMENGHLILRYLRLPPNFDTIRSVISNESQPLLLFCTQGPEEDFGVSSGYHWKATREYLETVEEFKALLTNLETVYNIHFGLASYRKFDWSRGPRDGMRLSRGTHRLIYSFGERKRMLFTSIDGKRATTLTLLNGSSILLSKDGEKLVSKIHPPYHLSDEDISEDNIPRTDPNEPSASLFLMLDVSAKGIEEESED